ncbi:FAD-dependent oxidoreductase [Arthrobacter gandavensis]|uniref:NAD(P)/FAD-dependent oxidoreductase n=1 Tax=Arthrobacter gandavensis TaxID=169960 RepID=UPI0018907A17|nr:FAD-dependent oxidoreductase [Arthrobacter gandavensis]MBF4994948.1 FAD-dependent oxidoreductase [Arthrobacter gandavensis]
METTAVILGGGYAGVMAANRLAGQGVSVRLVSPEERFTERIRLHEFMAGTRADPTVPFESLLNPDVELVHAAAEHIDPASSRVQLSGGAYLDYDWLIYAVGSGSGSVPSGAEAPDRLSGAGSARQKLHDLLPGDPVAVVGGGLTAVEVAAETAYAYPRNPVTIYAAGPLIGHFADSTRQRVLRSLARAGVRVRIQRVDPQHLPDAAAVLWCAGFTVPDLAARSGLPVDAAGRLMVDSRLRAQGHARIFGAGDAAVFTDPGYGYLAQTCATAMPMGAEAASNILRGLAGEPLPPHNSGFQAQCVSLGRRGGAVQFLDPGYVPRPFHLHGRSAALLKEVICRMTLRWIRGEAKRSGGYTWPAGPPMKPTSPVLQET